MLLRHNPPQVFQRRCIHPVMDTTIMVCICLVADLVVQNGDANVVKQRKSSVLKRKVAKQGDKYKSHILIVLEIP